MIPLSLRQVPLMYITDYLHKRMKNEYAGNLVFWCTFCVVGQPLACILYWQAWVESSAAQIVR